MTPKQTEILKRHPVVVLEDGSKIIPIYRGAEHRSCRSKAMQKFGEICSMQKSSLIEYDKDEFFREIEEKIGREYTKEERQQNSRLHDPDFGGSSIHTHNCCNGWFFKLYS